MKRIIIILLTVFIFFFMSVHSRKSTDFFKSISTESVKKISIKSLPELFSAVELNDNDEIEKIIVYLSELSIRREFRPGTLSGMVYIIDIYYNDRATNQIVFLSHRQITTNDKSYKISYEDATFDTVIGDILISRFRAEYTGTIIKGKVLSVTSAESGASIGCTVETSDGTKIEINLSTRASPILDVTGGGRLVLFVGDQIEVGVNDEALAERIYITDTKESINPHLRY